MKREIDNDCSTHGDSEKAHKKFWLNPLTSQWECKCKGVGRLELIKK